jgi:hypothetical protein
MALPILAGLGAGKIISIAGGSGLVGNVGNLLTSSLGSIATNPIGTLTNIGTSVGSAVGNFIGGIFGGGGNKAFENYVNANRDDIVIGNGTTPIAIFYNGIHKTEGKMILTEPMELPKMPPNWNDCISLIEFADGYDVHIYENDNYGGHHTGFNSNSLELFGMDKGSMRAGQRNEQMLLSLGRHNWNDKISSFKVLPNGTKKSNTVNQRSSNQPVQHGLPPNNFVESNFIGPQLPSNPVGNVGTIGINPFPNTTSNNQGSSNSMMYILLAVAGFFIFKKMK